MGVMHATSRRGRTVRRLLASDSGFALIEVMMSAVLVVVFATALLSVIEKSGQAAGTTRSRGVATQLAQQDQDAMRLMSIKTLAGYHATHAQTVAGINYSIQSDAEFLRDDAAGQVVCDASSARVEYVKITSAVTWPNHPTPVILESYVAPGVKGSSLGALTVKLHGDGAGRPTSGVNVNFQGQTVTTDSNGCAVFTALDPGTSNATWRGDLGLPMMVDKNGNTNVSTSVSVGSAATSVVDALFDDAATVRASFVDSTGASVSWNRLSAYNSNITSPSSATRSYNQGAKAPSLDASLLFPFATAYSFWAGSCAGNAPATWDTSTNWAHAGEFVAQPAATPATGGALNVTVPTVAVQTSYTGAGLVNGSNTGPVSFTPDTSVAKMAGCTDAISTSAGVTTNASSQAITALPWGVYTVCAKIGTLGTTGPKTWYGRRQIVNTPSTTTSSSPAQTHDALTLPAPYNSPLPAPYAANGTFATALLKAQVDTSVTNGMKSADGGVTTVSQSQC
jgi:Tfp pilus assembly protein PilV